MDELDLNKFLRDSDSLLQEIQRNDNTNGISKMRFHIYSNAIKSLEENVITSDYINAIIDLMNKIEKYIEFESTDYLWEFNPPHFRLIIEHSSAKEIYILGDLCYSNNVEDEWYLCSLLFKLTREFPELCINTYDDDGYFLLIEAAECLPDWLSPDNSDNRVWISGGKLHIIPLDVKSNKLSTREATSIVWLSNGKYADLSVQACLMNRLDKFPMYNSILKHYALCALPSSIANILTESPGLISSLIHAFSSVERPKKIKCLNSMTFLRSILPSFFNNKLEPSKKQFTDISWTTQDIVLVPVVFTKSSYAKFTFEPFSIPKALQTFQSLVMNSNLWGNRYKLCKRSLKSDSINAPSISNSISSRELTAAVDLGCRIMSAVELLYQTYIKDSQKPVIYNFPDGKLEDSKLSIANGVIDTLKALHQKCKLDFVDVSIGQNVLDSVSDLVNPPLFNSFKEIFDKLPSLSDQNLFSKVEVSNENKDEHEVITIDDDDWLYMTPDELDNEMNRRAASIVQSCSKDVGNISPDKPILPLSDIVDTMKLFMNSESGVEGIENTRSKNNELGKPLQVQEELVNKPVLNDIESKHSFKASILSNYSKLFNDDDISDNDSSSDYDNEEVELDSTNVVPECTEHANPIDGNDGDSTQPLNIGLSGCGRRILKQKQTLRFKENDSNDFEDQQADVDEEICSVDSDDMSETDFIDQYYVSI